MRHARLGLVVMALWCAAPARGADSSGQAAADAVNAQYQHVLEVIRRPTVTGVLVTEVLPDSAAGTVGLQAGDIITSYYGEQIKSLQTLREQVAEAVGRRIEEGATSHAMLRARRILPDRRSDDITLQLPREPLGIRAVEVQAGVEGPRNPPPSLRGKVKMNWAGVIDALRADGGVVAMRTQEQAAGLDTMEGDLWLGWQRYKISAEGTDRLSATLELARIDPEEEQVRVAEQAGFAFRMQLGDYYTTPAFLLESASADYATVDGRVQVKTRRLGETFTAETAHAGANAGKEAVKSTHPAPLTALVQPAVPLVAAAMPHDADAVLALHLVSVRDFVPRPGYVLASRGKQPLPAAGAERGWRVDLLHFGVAIESYWFSDGCRMLCVESNVGRPVISRRVLKAGDATVPLEHKVPATAPDPRHQAGQ